MAIRSAYVTLLELFISTLQPVHASLFPFYYSKTEAVCNLPNGVGIVKLMGRSAGFIAAHATMASYDVDLCLVPEVPIQL